MDPTRSPVVRVVRATGRAAVVVAALQLALATMLGNLPATVRSLPAGSTQVITVTAPRYATTHARLIAWQKVDGRWRVVHGPVDARIGWGGFSTRGEGQRRQGDGTTPVGVYPLGQAFGNAVRPTTAMPWRAVDSNDYWVYDPRDARTYNTYQASRPSTAVWRTSWAEHLAGYGSQYAYAVVIGFNLPTATRPADTTKGGGIFLHVNGTGATAGCVSVPRDDMVALLRWLDPAKRPVIVLGPQSVLPRL